MYLYVGGQWDELKIVNNGTKHKMPTDYQSYKRYFRCRKSPRTKYSVVYLKWITQTRKPILIVNLNLQSIKHSFLSSLRIEINLSSWTKEK